MVLAANYVAVHLWPGPMCGLSSERFVLDKAWTQKLPQELKPMEWPAQEI